MEIYFGPIKQLIIQGKSDLTPQTIEGYRRRLISITNECVKTAIEAGSDIRAVSNSRFAFYALVDEILLDNYAVSSYWREMLLQQSFYNTTNAGSLFFEILKQDYRLERQSVTTYLWCLMAGFKGVFGHTNNIEELHRITVTLSMKSRDLVIKALSRSRLNSSLLG